ncbi:MAG: LUD domain-containing protein [candidate division WOR-3 bacterium]|uniref:4Fe-4S dicluster domain-containing protein n=1 Tax=candidate division WOR-3 bacterium TaxID=2052148 RepID=A0A7V4ABW0_UNCW3
MENVHKKYAEFQEEIYKYLYDEFTRLALRRAIASFREARDKALEEFPYVKEERKKLIKIKDEVISNLDFWIEKAMKSVEKSKGKAYYAKDVNEALEIIKKIVGTGKIVVKAKSITSEELHLNKHLEEWGNKVYETDLGEFIVQLIESRPMHILAPAVNISRERVAEIFSRLAGEELPPDIPKLVKFARKFLREKYFEADIGISGANAITADTGSIFLLENEGNIRFVTNAPPVHIAIVGIEKILPTFRDGSILTEVVARYAGYNAMSYVSIISGPSKTGDIEKTVVYGAHGPEEFHVIFLDNGRKEAAKEEIIKQALRCVRCGVCMYECPVYAITTGYWGYIYMGGIGIPWTAYVAGGFLEAAPLAFTCITCNRCKVFCPMEIDTGEIVLRIREILREKGFKMPFLIRASNKVKVNEDKCSGCGICISVCPFKIPEFKIKKGKRISYIGEACLSCGSCISSCPSKAIEAFEFDDEKIYSLLKEGLS